MKNTILGTLRAAAILCVAGAMAHGVGAQPAVPPVPLLQPMADPLAWHVLSVHYVSPAFVAWWVDPHHNPAPATPPNIQHAYDSRDEGDADRGVFSPQPSGSQPATTSAKYWGDSRLPQGVEMLVPLVGKHALLSYATAGGVQQLQKIIGYLDKPTQYVEIDAKIVELNQEDLVSFGGDFDSSNGPFSFHTSGLTPATTAGAISRGTQNNWLAQIETLVAARKARVLLDSQITTVNNWTADAQSSYSAVEAGAQGGYPGYVTVQDKLALTPTVNNDGTITVVVGIKHARTFYDDTTGPGVSNSSEMTTTANIKDGDTIAIGGAKDRDYVTNSTGTGAANGAEQRPDRYLLVFVTAHVMKPG